MTQQEMTFLDDENTTVNESIKVSPVTFTMQDNGTIYFYIKYNDDGNLSNVGKTATIDGEK